MTHELPHWLSSDKMETVKALLEDDPAMLYLQRLSLSLSLLFKVCFTVTLQPQVARNNGYARGRQQTRVSECRRGRV